MYYGENFSCCELLAGNYIFRHERRVPAKCFEAKSFEANKCVTDITFKLFIIKKMKKMGNIFTISVTIMLLY